MCTGNMSLPILTRLVRPPMSEEDDFHIRTVIEQYSSAPPSCRRALFIDRLMRGLHHKTREELVGICYHSLWCSSHGTVVVVYYMLEQ